MITPSAKEKRARRVKDDPRDNYEPLLYNTPSEFDRSVTYDAASVPYFESFYIVGHIMKCKLCENDDA